MVLARLEIDDQSLVRTCTKARQIVLRQLDRIVYLATQVGQGFPQRNPQKSKMLHAFLVKLDENQIVGFLVFTDRKLLLPKFGHRHGCFQ